MRRKRLVIYFISIFLFSLFVFIPTTTRAQIEPTLNIFLHDIFPELRFESPVDIVHASDSRLFIVEQPGTIWVIDDGAKEPIRQNGASVFLDIEHLVTSGGERGLLGLAFHPNYINNGFFYVNYTHNQLGSLHTRIARYAVSDNPEVADPNSEFVIMDIPQPFNNHNAGDLVFDEEGFLYIPTGDGGSGGDPGNRAQNLDDLLGKILRIDINGTTAERNYTIPGDNPFVGQNGRDEIWAYGLRNPWRVSFDRLTGDLFIGDVGQRQFEEVSIQAADSDGGENYGWRLKEGFDCFDPSSNCDPGGLTDPIFVYGHNNGRCSITGGFVYRGQQFPTLQGTYLAADFCTGELFGLRQEENGRWQPSLHPTGIPLISTFGEGANGELYAASHNGIIYQVQATPLPFRAYLPISN
ncbi:MAG: PQQ-dependent sugar dehydrogenase [Chloroflexota bacterium]